MRYTFFVFLFLQCVSLFPRSLAVSSQRLYLIERVVYPLMIISCSISLFCKKAQVIARLHMIKHGLLRNSIKAVVPDRFWDIFELASLEYMPL